MEISETRVKLTGNANDRLKAVCSVTIDSSFVIRDIKVIEGATGLFVAMPSRKLADHCPKCRNKNHLRARFCNECGAKLDENRAERDRSGRMKLHADIAHPINSECRSQFQAKVVEAFQAESARAQQPGYKPVQFEDDDEGATADHAEHHAEPQGEPQGEHREQGDQGGHGDHADLIAELKRDAEARHAKRSGESRGGGRAEGGPSSERERPAETERLVERERTAERSPASEPAGEPNGFGAGLV